MAWSCQGADVRVDRPMGVTVAELSARVGTEPLMSDCLFSRSIEYRIARRLTGGVYSVWRRIVVRSSQGPR